MAVAVVLTPARPVLATVQTSGIVYAYFNDPINGLTYGLPFFGNDVDFFPGPPSNAATFEYDAEMGPANTTLDNEIVVGKGARGDLVISGSSILRAEHLIIGDVRPVGDVDRGGLGIVRVTGFASTYNNDPNITALHPSVIGTSWTSIRVPDAGYDLYVGRGVGSTGDLQISAGGNVEIQDAVIVGDGPSTTGTIQVDGVDSTLWAGGFDGPPSSVLDPHLMIIGRRGGVGIMRILNGATVVAQAVPGGAPSGDVNFGASIGSFPAQGSTPPDIVEAGGQGNVTVTGIGSKWIIGGSLQIGGFHDAADSTGTGRDFEGDDVLYNTEVGQSTVHVDLGGFISIQPAIEATANDRLLLAIGRAGRLELNGGWVSIGNPGTRTSDIQLFIDGVIEGGGRIDTGVFRNRYLGQLIVNSGQSLIVAASSEFVSGSAFEDEPLANFGLIEVTGEPELRAELEFERAPGTPTRPIRPFLNLLLPEQPDPAASRGGLIVAEHATLRFGSGLQNRSRVAFTAGLNIVHGDVVNFGDPEIAADDDDGDGDGDIGDFTQLLVAGPDTRVVFQNQLGHTGNADIDLENGGNIEVLQDFAAAGGEISIELSRNNPSAINVLGDVGLSGIEFNFKFANDVFPLEHGDAFEIIHFGGSIGGVDLTDPFRPVPDLAIAPSIVEITTSPDIDSLNPDLDLVIEFATEGVYALILDPTMVGMGAIGPDFNGDGMVDLLDLDIWLANVGCEAGCSVLQGDADGDGDVDGDDFLFWQRNVGMPPPWAGAGAGAGQGASVPEPTGLALLVSGGMLALALRRRRLR